jgi:hypothetical protein
MEVFVFVDIRAAPAASWHRPKAKKVIEIARPGRFGPKERP